MESFLNTPNKFEEVNNNLKKPIYNFPSKILPLGIYPDDVYVIISTPRTKIWLY